MTPAFLEESQCFVKKVVEFHQLGPQPEQPADRSASARATLDPGADQGDAKKEPWKHGGRSRFRLVAFLPFASSDQFVSVSVFANIIVPRSVEWQYA